MAPRFTSFKSVWNKVMQHSDIENAVSPEKPIVPKRNPLSLSASTSALSSSTSSSVARSTQRKGGTKFTVSPPEDGEPASTSASMTGSFEEANAIDASCRSSMYVGTAAGGVNETEASAAVPVLRDMKTPSVAGSDVGSTHARDHSFVTPRDTVESAEEHTPLELPQLGHPSPVAKAYPDAVQSAVPDAGRDSNRIVKHSEPLQTSQAIPQAKSEADPIPSRPAEVVHEDILNELELQDDPLDSGMFRALIFTDTHLGHKEGDPVRGNDAFNAFEEVLFLAKHLSVDAIFHSGDMFDDSHPSRAVMYRTMELLRQYCGKGEGTPGADTFSYHVPRDVAPRNEERRKLALQGFHIPESRERRIPFFVIHGNHDNPTALNGLSPIDLLDVSGLVTFFGTTTDMNRVELRPILLRKGSINVALYGLGWVKDDYLYQAFEEGRVVFVPPSDLERNWYNVLLFHQNRYPRRGKGTLDYIPETLLPEWLDLVVWGHEHECLKYPQRCESRNFHILQLGSTVQTSMAASEMAPKHCCLLELDGERVTFSPITLETARQLHYSDISLAQLGITNGSENDIGSKLSTMVNHILNGMRNRPKTALRASQVAHITISRDDRFKLRSAVENAERLPLIRLRVDHSGFDSINPRTFGNNFVGRVANPADILRFWQKHPSRSLRPEASNGAAQDGDLGAGAFAMDVKNTVFPAIEQQCRLKLLLERELNDAVERFAMAMEAPAIADYVRKSVEQMHEVLRASMAEQAGSQLCENVYDQIVEREILARTQAARVQAGLDSSRASAGILAESTSMSDVLNPSGVMDPLAAVASNSYYVSSAGKDASVSLGSSVCLDASTKSTVPTHMSSSMGPALSRGPTTPRGAAASLSNVDSANLGVSLDANTCADFNQAPNTSGSVDLGSSMLSGSGVMRDFMAQSPRLASIQTKSPVREVYARKSESSPAASPLRQNQSMSFQTHVQSAQFPTPSSVFHKSSTQSQQVTFIDQGTPASSSSSHYAEALRGPKRERSGDSTSRKAGKRVCSQELPSGVTTAEIADALMPVESIALLGRGRRLGHVGSINNDDKPLELSDFDDTVLPLASSTWDRSTGSAGMERLQRDSQSHLGPVVDLNTPRLSRNEDDSYAGQQTIVRSSPSASPLRGLSSQLEDSKDSPNQRNCSQGFRNTLISMFFKKK
ncbi:Mre11 DNA-binding domain-containing protein [Babesia caballi]|uniref:Mre11 DNA-binding domain-containing protein n=1 Tax=Babesia caballi TaxID=5871 RepID=A0AAV4LLF5_BABCB|nr:Mre11 DNA-binding domain-containing protein [Babesia caballi]